MQEITQITLHQPLDMHLHLRDSEILNAVIDYSARSFCGGVIMPNLIPPIASSLEAVAYKKRILEATNERFYPMCAIYLTESLDKKELESCAKYGFKLLKLYPKGATTNSQSGVKDIISDKMRNIFEIAQDIGMIVCIHSESSGFVLEREYEFGRILRILAADFSKLRIIIEHISDSRIIPLLREFENLYATITFHHITMSLDSLLGGALNPHHFCKPTLKTKTDQESLLLLALNADKKVCFGSDSAPHSLESKLKGAAGIFSAPCLIEQLVELFEKHNAIHNLQAFISDNAKEIYRLNEWAELPTKDIKLIKKQSSIPERIYFNDKSQKTLENTSINSALASAKLENTASNNILVPLNAGKTIAWSLAD